jgi:hypothetical protein
MVRVARGVGRRGPVGAQVGRMLDPLERSVRQLAEPQVAEHWRPGYQDDADHERDHARGLHRDQHGRDVHPVAEYHDSENDAGGRLGGGDRRQGRVQRCRVEGILDQLQPEDARDHGGVARPVDEQAEGMTAIDHLHTAPGEGVGYAEHQPCRGAGQGRP